MTVKSLDSLSSPRSLQIISTINWCWANGDAALFVKGDNKAGELNVHDFVDGMADYPEIIEVRKEADETKNFGGSWHSDVSYLEAPALRKTLFDRLLRFTTLTNLSVLSGINDPKLRTTDHATIALAKQGVDLYGNKVGFEDYGGGSYQMTVDPEDQHSPKFWCKVVTGRGNVFIGSASTYDHPSG